jgi:hypothetical protein
MEAMSKAQARKLRKRRRFKARKAEIAQARQLIEHGAAGGIWVPVSEYSDAAFEVEIGTWQGVRIHESNVP